MERLYTIDNPKLPILHTNYPGKEAPRSISEGIPSTEQLMPLITEAAKQHVDFIGMSESLTKQERSMLTRRSIGVLLELDSIHRTPLKRSGLQLKNFRALHGDYSGWYEEIYRSITEMTPAKQDLANVKAYFGIVELFSNTADQVAARRALISESSQSTDEDIDARFITATGLEQAYFAFKDPGRIVNPEADPRFQITAIEQARLEHGDKIAEYKSILLNLQPEINKIEIGAVDMLRFSSSAQRRHVAKEIQHTIRGMRDDQQIRVLTLQGLPEDKAVEFRDRLQKAGRSFAKIVIALESLGYSAAGVGGVFPILGNITDNTAHVGLGLSYGLYYALMGLVGLQNARMSEYEIPSLNPFTQASVEAMKQSPHTTKWMRYTAGILSNYGSEGLLDFFWSFLAAANPTSTVNGNIVGVLGGIGQALFAERKIREKKRIIMQQSPKLSGAEKDVL